jgi:outer membrane protein assembly factor BamB
VADGKVIVNIGAKEAAIVAFDTGKGKVAWKELNDRASYASPTIFTFGTVRQMVFLTGAELVSLSPKDGTVFWQYPFKDFLLESSTTPIRAGNLLIGSSITRGTVALKLAMTNDKPSAAKQWANGSLTSYFSTPIAVGDYLYIVTGATPPASQADLHCVALKDGKELWKQAKVGKYHASLLRTGDNKLLMLEEAGNLILLEPNAEQYRELARSRICGMTWAHPAVSNGRLYIRDGRELICVELPGS